MPTPSASLTPSSPALTRIGRFYITRELGRGNVGCVYLGHDPVIGRDIAIKTCHPRMTPAERCRHERQFINEARAAGLLSHPNIVTVYDASVEQGMAYIAMEYLRGRELDKILDSGHRYAPDDAAAIVWRIADALNHAHERKVIHRDVKPANIFMVGDDQPKLVDFGIARAPNRVAEKDANPDNPVTIMVGNRRLGTPNYMSPEQALGKPVDARTDIYSLGAVMYEMLVGRKPFQSENADKLLQQVASKVPPAPHEVDPSVPPALSEIVMKAMRKRPEKRYETAGKMALDIKRFLVRQRRARRRMKIPVAALDRNQPVGLPLLRSKLFWAGSSALAAAAAVAAAFLMD
ncbi:serine/threonine protein kinase [Noviherbaspirillum denitrificans]|uniref:non-specific serine/threonine protein kinase n=1 Tax=Noviherbaspirillum denitrificans TaxID=1968433 RepID=A0A254TSZ8_9BURK|nr:serine/threonine-protein kinase [Noviherbaspirillum denitrificans]OWW22858.1 serine/threonine protein kinase [Noviherbaspirillum denitrificans]